MSINLQQTAQIHKQKSHKTVVPCIETLLDSMQEGNIKKNIVFGLPVKKKWESFEPREPHDYLGDNARCIYYNATDDPPKDSFLHGKTMARYNALLDKLHDNAKHKIAELHAEKMYFNHQKSTR